MTNSKYKILFVHQVSEVGGASFCMLNLLKALDKDCFHPIVVLPKKGPLSEELDDMGMEVVFLSSLCIYPYNRSLFSYKSWREIMNVYASIPHFKRLLKLLNPDIVYLNNTFLFPYLKVIKRLRINSIIHIRENWPNDQHQKQFGFVKSNILKNASHIVAINKYSASMICGEEKCPTIIYDWIDMESRKDDTHLGEIIGEDTSKLRVFIFTGGIARIKGSLEVLSAFKDYVTDPNARLLALGVNTNISQNGLINKVKYFLYKLGLPTYTYKVKDIVESDKRIKPHSAIYNITNVFKECYCNLSYFTSPHANLGMAECITLKTPVIAASTPETDEYTNNGELAALFKINDYEDFITKIKTIEEWRGDLKGRLETGSDIIKTKFSKSINTNKFNQMLKKISGID